MNYILATLFVVGSVVTGSGGIKYLSYNVDSVASDFHRDIAGNRIQFLSVCGFSCEAPGVGALEVTYCYGSFSRIHTIDDTGDVVSSDMLEFKRAARTYATAYNRMLASYLDKNRMTSCSKHEQWTRAWLGINDYLVKTNSDLSGISAPTKPNGVFEISLRKDVAPIPLMNFVCSTFEKNGISRKTEFSVSITEKLSGKWKGRKLFIFSCLGDKPSI